MKKVAILQSNYIPWKGYFDIINMVDEFILYDDMQYTKRDWRNRNVIKTPRGKQWLTIPVNTKGKFDQKIKDVTVTSSDWAKDHWRTLQCNYASAPCYELYAERIRKLYETCQNEQYLSRINYIFLKEICSWLGIHTKISWSSDYHLIEGKTEKLVDLCKQAEADEYISGPAAKDYIIESLFAEERIKLSWMDYSGYSEYTQLYGDFIGEVSILDMFFNLGEKAKDYMKSF